MRTDGEELEERLSRHPAEETLVDYYYGRLGDIEHVTVQCHLIDCDDCVADFRDAADSLTLAGASDAAMSAKEIAQVWKGIVKGVKPNGLEADRPSKVAFARWSGLAAAAIAVLLLVAAGAWVMKLRHDNERLTEQTRALALQLERTQNDLKDRIGELEKQSTQQGQAQERGPDNRPQEARSAPLGLNVPVYNIYSTEWVRRSGEEREANRISLSPGAESIVLILVGESHQDSSEYAIEIIDPRGRSVRYNRGLSKNNLGNFVISINQRLFRPGIYRILVHGRKGSTPEEITEYVVKVG